MNFLSLKAFSRINKRFLEKEIHTTCHMAASGRATCHADISTGSASADVIVDLVNPGGVHMSAALGH